MASPEQLQPGERDFAPEFETSGRVYGLVPHFDLGATEGETDFSSEELEAARDLSRGTDSTDIEESARIRLVFKIAGEKLDPTALFDPRPGYSARDHKRPGGDEPVL